MWGLTGVCVTWGWQEAQWLLDQGLLPDERCAARAIGYRQAMDFLHSCKADPTRITAPNLVRICVPCQLTHVHVHIIFVCPFFIFASHCGAMVCWFICQS